MRILNLFAGIGGNRTLWGDKHEITAVEYDQKIAMIYLKRFPKDKVIVGDAYEYFLKHFDEYDFIWASPPCTTHTGLVLCNMGHRKKGYNKYGKLPDLRLYSLIIFCQSHFEGKYVIENVKPYYKALLPPNTIIGRHYIWTNIPILTKTKTMKAFKGFDNEITEDFLISKGIDKETMDLLNKSSIKNKKQVLNNCVFPEEGKYILDSIINKKQTSLEVFQ